MEIEEIKQKISELAIKHEALDTSTLEEIEYEWIEEEAEELIIAYCVQQGYLVNGFPTEKRKQLEEDGMDEDEMDDYFCRDRYRLYLDTLATDKEDVAEIWWHYNHSFWPEWTEDKVEFIKHIKETISNEVSGIQI